MTEGRRALLKVLTKTERRYVAARCRRDVKSVERWASGSHKPGQSARQSLCRHYRIPPESWDIFWFCRRGKK